jgi:hypothetical protein
MSLRFLLTVLFAVVCTDAQAGEANAIRVISAPTRWKVPDGKTFPGAPGGYSASPVLAEGRIYLASEEGKISVIRPGRESEVLKVNDIGDGFSATPALSGGQLFARGAGTLYCFGTK